MGCSTITAHSDWYGSHFLADPGSPTQLAFCCVAILLHHAFIHVKEPNKCINKPNKRVAAPKLSLNLVLAATKQWHVQVH